MGDISLRGVALSRQQPGLLAELDLEVAPGERVCLLGASGSGKTALLRAIAGLDPVTAGEIAVRPETRRRLTMVFQDDAVYDHLDVERNISFPLQGAAGGSDIEKQVREAANRFYLGGLLSRRPGTLSTGQRTAVSTARALARSDLSVVLLDGPLIGTDPHLRQRLLEAVMSEPELTVIFASREGSDALRWADRVAVLAGGRLAQVGLPLEVYRAPGSLEVAELMGELNRIPAVARAGGVDIGGSRLAMGLPAVENGRRLVVGLRPLDLIPARDGTPFDRRLRATVGRIEQVGATQRVMFGLGERPGVGFAAEIEADYRMARGVRIDWYVAPDAVRLYDPVSGSALG
ncbi:MAG TPA: ABC transporter ATP-binding protein [Acidimicrobiia bacterium]|nr:ABC transporter ATP-binding protein [Acidimicrobiia bacterium]